MYYNERMTTEVLLKQCVDRDLTAWDKFACLYNPLVIKSVRYKLGKMNVRVSKSEYRDIAQEIFLFIWEKEKLSGVRDPKCLKSWLIIFSLNFTSNYCRKMLKKSEDTFSFDDTLVPSFKFTPTKMLESKELGNIIKEKIAEFDNTQQLALKLHIYHNKKQKDIAGIMNLPIGTVSTLLRRGKSILRERLRDTLDI